MTMRILCVDDSPTVQDMLAVTLRTAGFETLQAQNGVEGLKLLKTASVDLIITDVNMWLMGGFEFVSKVRQDPVHEFTPILFLTTEASEEFKQYGRDVGATGWLCKPFHPAELVKVVRQITH